MKRYILVLFLFIAHSAIAQNTIDSYKYIILPQKFSFLKTSDQYSLNSLAKQLLENRGFTVVYDGTALPPDVLADKCAALSANVLSKGGMFATNLTLTLKDCRGNIVFESKTGSSREKDFATAYSQALREAIKSLYQTPYTYNGANGKVTTQASVTAAPPIAPAATSPTTIAAPAQPDKTLYAQPIPNGYQLVDVTPKKVLTLLNTSSTDHFIANNDAVTGIVFKLNNDWVFEYYSDGKLVTEKLLIKF